MQPLSKKEYAIKADDLSEILDRTPNLNNKVPGLPRSTFLLPHRQMQNFIKYHQLEKVVKFHNPGSPALSLKVSVQHKYRTITGSGEDDLVKRAIEMQDEYLGLVSEMENQEGQENESTKVLLVKYRSEADRYSRIVEAYRDKRLTVHMSNFHRHYQYEQFSMKCEDGRMISSHYAKTKLNIVFISEHFGKPRSDYKMEQFLEGFEIWPTKDLYDLYYHIEG